MAGRKKAKRPPVRDASAKEALRAAKHILSLEAEIYKLPDADDSINNRNALGALMSQQALAAPTVARWVVATLARHGDR